MKTAYKKNEKTWVYQPGPESGCYKIAQAIVVRRAMNHGDVLDSLPYYVLEWADGCPADRVRNWDDCFIRSINDMYETREDCIKAVLDKRLRPWLKDVEQREEAMTHSLICEQHLLDRIKRQIQRFEKELV